LSTPGLVLLKSALAASVFVLLLPAAAIGARSAPGRLRRTLSAFTLAGVLLVLGVIGVRLEEGNEHNISNLAQVVLAVPAAGIVAWTLARRRIGDWRALALIAAVCTPTAVATVVSFTGRPALPLAYGAGRLIRTPADGPLQRAYDWIREHTPNDAIIVIDPDRPLKMSGNVTEIPAFTGRALFTDQPGYLETPHADATRRAGIAHSLVRGAALSQPDASYLHNLGRPLYLLVYGAPADRPPQSLWGPPVFAAAPVTIYAIGR
jgi:hypothetical protein